MKTQNRDQTATAECNGELFEFPGFSGRKIEAKFTGGDVTSDGGILLLRKVDQLLGLTEAVNKVLPDPRDPLQITHPQLDLLRQRIYGLALGYEDLNDQNTLRHDPAWQTALNRTDKLGSGPTLCRLENRINRQAAVDFHKVILDQFIASHRQAPQELILDFDSTDDRVHGNQQGSAYHGYYGDWCFLPLYVFCGEQLLVSYLRPSNRDPARHAWALLSLLVKRLRIAWPQVRIILRADSGFSRWKMYRWCDKNNVHYIVGLAQNKAIKALAAPWMEQAEAEHKRTQDKVRLFTDLTYGAQTWDRPRRVITKAEHLEKGSNPRFVVTNLEGDAQYLYDHVYCARGEMENRIKEQQLGLFADRTSCHAWWANQFRLLLSSLAYTLLEALRRLGLAGTQLARAQVTTIRLKLLKMGAIIIRNTRRIRFLLSESYPYQDLFWQVCRNLQNTFS
jgi:hypothetical protein